MRSPFKFLDSYGIRDKDVFFGREKEVDALYALVFKTPLTLLYGLSGTGKTSIIQCGLANRFDGPDWLPFFIRREQDINQSLRKTLLDALGEPSDAGLPDLISALFDDYLRPVYLIFDQLEELFILGTPEEQAHFAAGLKELQERKLPCRIILVIREEYLGQLYPVEKEIPTLFDHRLRIEPMNNARVQVVLEKSFDKFNIALETPAEELRQAIIDNMSAGKSGIQLPYLQVYLDLLYREHYSRKYGDQERGETLPQLVFSHREIADFGKMDNVLDKFLQEQSAVLQLALAARHPGLPAHTVRMVLDAFVTEDGTKRPVFLKIQEGEWLPEAPFKALFPEMPPALLTDCLRLLEQSRLLRISENSAELAHDSLASLIDRQRSDEQRQLNEVKRRITAAHLEKEKTGDWPTERQLLSMEEFFPKINLAPHLQQFLQESYAELERRRESAEKERQLKLEAAEQQAAQEKRLRQEAERYAHRASQRTRAALAGILFALVAAVVAGYFGYDANRQKAAAEKATLEAEENFILAEDNLKKAKAEEEKAKAALLLVEKEKAATEEQRQKAEANYKLAEAKTKEAEAQRIGAAAERDKAQAALDNLEKANASTVELLLAIAERDILIFHYEEALEKQKAAASLGALKPQVAAALLQTAFWHGEIGNTQRAISLLDLAAALVNKEADHLKPFRASIEAFDPAVYKTIMERYYPVTVKVEGGTFEMGCDPGEACGDLHPQEVSSFQMATYETTWWQYYLFCQATGHEYESPSWGILGDNPALNVSWFDAVLYSNWVNNQLGLDTFYVVENKREGVWGDYYEVTLSPTAKKGYRLPTEAEWEYAAKGGPHQSPFIYAGSDDKDTVAWYAENSGRRTHPVGQKKANALGLYDMSGNVFEWCWDWSGAYPKSSKKDYAGPEDGPYRVIRGGAWNAGAAYCRAANRGNDTPDGRNSNVGFRLVFVP